MYCVRDKDEWYCVPDDTYMGWWLDNKNATPEHKEEYIRDNGTEYYVNKEGLYVQQYQGKG